MYKLDILPNSPARIVLIALIFCMLLNFKKQSVHFQTSDMYFYINNSILLKNVKENLVIL